MCYWSGKAGEELAAGRARPALEGLSPLVPADEYASDPRALAIADAAWRLVALRGRWINPHRHG